MPTVATTKPRVLCGADRLFGEAASLIAGKRVGILTNHTGRLSHGLPIVDAVVASGLATVTALFGPEHGLTGDSPNGNAVGHSRHGTLGIPVYSLYGKTHKPTASMLGDVDVLVCDIQDVGARFYTYVSTVALALEAAAEAGKPFVLLDRPNPVRGLRCDGPVRRPQLRSFVGWMPIPVLHGMTIGELATMWNEEGWLAGGVKAQLEVVKLKGWKRSMWYDETGLPWVAPSPNLPRMSTATIYPGQCFFEGTSISEGRGTDAPFELVGAPWADPDAVARELAAFATPGAAFTPESFVPREIPGVAADPKFLGEECRGLRVTLTDRDVLDPVRLGISMISAFSRAHPAETKLRLRRFDILVGNSTVRNMIDRHASPDEICASWADEVRTFDAVRHNYLFYP